MSNIPRSIQNNLLVNIGKKFEDEIVASGGTVFYQDTSFRPEWNVTLTGKVISTPLTVNIGDGSRLQSMDLDRPRINQNVKPGDEIIFSYTVIMNRSSTDNAGDIFERKTPVDPYTTVWTNHKGLEIVRIYLNNNKFEIGLFDTKSKTWVDRVKGTEHDVESFMGKYMPTQQVSFNFGNLVAVDNKEYWKVDYKKAIAIKKNGNFEMVGDYVMLEPLREPNRRELDGTLFIYNLEQSKDYRAIGKVVSIGEPLEGDPKLGVQPNDNIVTDIRYVEKYEIDGHDYWVVRQKYIYGKTSVIDEHIGNP